MAKERTLFETAKCMCIHVLLQYKYMLHLYACLPVEVVEVSHNEKALIRRKDNKSEN